MVVNESRPKGRANEDGQSVFEFLFTLPVLVWLSVILIRINTAIQVSIVDQQYARAQALFLTFNSPFYPILDKQDLLVNFSTNQMMIGVADNQILEGTVTPKATVQLVSRKRGNAPNSPKEEPNERELVRIRNTVTLCTPTYSLAPGFPILNPDRTSNLTDKTRFNFICGSNVRYE